MLRSWLLWFLLQILGIRSGHYKGGTITWKPTSPNATGSRVEILISERHSFTLVTRYPCTENTISNQLSYVDGGGTAAPDISCYSSSASCTSSLFNTIQHTLLCTDFSNQLDSSSGAYFTKQNLSRTTNIDVAFYSNTWASVILMSNGVGATYWYVGTHINLGVVTPINSSPGQYLSLFSFALILSTYISSNGLAAHHSCHRK